MKVTKEIVEALLRERGLPDGREIIWRDDLQSTYQDVYDYLISRPNRTFENFGIENENCKR